MSQGCPLPQKHDQPAGLVSGHGVGKEQMPRDAPRHHQHGLRSTKDSTLLRKMLSKGRWKKAVWLRNGPGS